MFQIPSEVRLSFDSSSQEFALLTSPNDGSTLCRVQQASESDVTGLLKKLPGHARLMRQLSPERRVSGLTQVADRIRAEAAELAWLISTEGGKPLRDARVEVERAELTFHLCAEEALKLGKTEPFAMDLSAAGANHKAWHQRVPMGVVLAISAFNHPLNLLAHQVGPALAGANAVVLKPAPATPLCAEKLRGYVLAAGFPPEALTVVHCGVPEIRQLVSAQEIDYVSFIGSARVGWELRRLLAPGTRLGLEHGGVAPAVVRADADLPQAVAQLIKGAFYHAGQVCISTQRIFVAREVFQNFLELFQQEASKLCTGPATSEETDVGPLIRPGEVVRLRQWISEALAAGAELVQGNSVSGPQEQYLSPTILSNVPRSSLLMREEAFGPVVCVNAYDDEAELINYLQSSPYVFESALFTRDIEYATKLAAEIPAMTLVINNHTAYRVDWMPFGGHKLSGLGMGGVHWAVEEMTRLQQVIVRTPSL